MFEAWKRIVFTAFLVSNCHFVTTLLCYCTSHNNVEPVFENNVTAKTTSKIILKNKCFTGSIHGHLFCPENHTFCIKREDLHSTSCDETLHNSASAYWATGTANTAKRLPLDTGTEYMGQRRFIADDGRWGEWGPWEGCVATSCGEFGIHRRKRECLSKSVVAHCVGDDVELNTCFINCTVKVDGQWSEWSTWSTCSSYTAKDAMTHRLRKCDNPPASNGGAACPGKSWEILACSDLSGIWSDWGNWSACSVTCGQGTQQRQRQCQRTIGQCTGNDTITQTCTEIKNCPVNGKFSEWSQWSACPVTCGAGPMMRNRYCDNPKPQFGGSGCVGAFAQADLCNTQHCPIDGHFTDWSPWQSCSATCGTGTKERLRSCTNPPPSNGGDDCSGPSKDTDTCYEAVCSVDGEWGQWQAWAQCTCGNTHQRKRDCDSPAPVANGAYCVGSATDTAPCTPDTSLKCPVAGGWTDWLEWGTRCSVTCGHGAVKRFRQCANPIPSNGGAYCAGDLFQSRECIQPRCPVDGVWSSWSAWSHCDVTCANGTQFRNRTCNNPMPQYGGKDCQGGVGESKICTQNPCPVNGMWGAWLAWSSWDVTCAQGSRSRIRTCNSPAPMFNGHDCPGDFNGHESKDLGNCPVDGSWDSWTTWTKCSVTCENGTQTRTRTCSNPPPQYGGLDCVGDRNETQVCTDRPSCVIDGSWSDWSAWFGCSVTCGQGTDKRYRACNNPLPQNGGRYCQGPFSESTNCTLVSCPVDGKWADWGSWGSCSVSCSNGTSVRIRTCSNPYAEYGGKQCDGSSTDVRDCLMGLCTIDGSWSAWSAWFGCSVTCGKGTDKRYRACNNPVPKNGGRYCQGSFSESMDCALVQCPVDGNWADWGSWGSCSVTCSNGTSVRIRSCSNPYPKYGGKQCVGNATAVRDCFPKVCTIDGNWAVWGSWGSCSVTCSNGTSERIRTCDNPKPQNGGKNCTGAPTEIVNCFEKVCPIDGSWGSWTPWSRCMGDCNSGNKQRYRNCDNPMPDHGGQTCAGPPFETMNCLPKNCTTPRLPVVHQVTASSWSRWFYDTCTTTCGPGTTNRLRHCNTGHDEDCHGNAYETVTCNLGHCPVSGAWSAWQPWSVCSRSCGEGSWHRTRSCDNPPPQYGGPACTGTNNETAVCKLTDCPRSRKDVKNHVIYKTGNRRQNVEANAHFTFQMFEVCKIIVFTAFLVSNCHFVTTLLCYCTSQHNVEPVFENNITANATTKIILENKCFAGSIHGHLFCPENHTFCIKLEDLHSTSCDETVHNSASAYWTTGTANTAKRLTMDAGTEYMGQRRFIADDGQWGEWGPWDQCIATSCGEFGIHRRKRECLSKSVVAHCDGDDVELDKCFLNCTVKVDGQWSDWSTWSTCTSFTAKDALTHRIRQCDNPPASHGGKTCPGKSWEIIACSNLTSWEPWGSWSVCYQTAGIDLQFRNRTCRRDPCDGEKLGAKLCHEPPTFKDWGPWGACSVTCGLGDQTRHRQCDNGTPDSTSTSVPCLGNSSESRQCMDTLCHGSDLAYWSEWSAWSFCEPPCDSGTSTRHRVCHGNSTCQGASEDNVTCSQNVCNIGGGWSTWEEWSACNYGPSYSVTVRLRSCSNPYPKNSGKDCFGNYWGIEACKQESAWGAWVNVGHCIIYDNTSLQLRNRSCHIGLGNETCDGKDFSFEPCELKGIWSDWGNWSSCSVTCGEGTQQRHRQCQNTTDQCRGNDTITQTCTDVKNCPVDGKFSEWTQWSACPVTCGGGPVTRNRYCNNPKPQYGGNGCVGAYSDTSVCNTQDCPVDGHYTDWSSWQLCSATCGNGTKERTRSCTNPAPSNGGDDCAGPNKDTDTCNEAVCSVDGEWGQWQAWAQCTCESTHQRKRDCDSPAPVANGAYCVGNATDTAPCTPDTSLKCPVAGGWADWLEWGTRCSVTCGHGVVKRFRQCANPIPSNGGAYCAGELFQTRECNQPHCPVDGVWSSWSAWSHCDVTCANGTQFRNRTCNSPTPQYGGKDCQGGVGESKICTQNPCPINGMWGEWLAWSNWDVTCAHGSRSRIRKCDNPAPMFGGQDCPGDFNGHESKVLGNCPVNGSWGGWTTWTKCSVTCENGTHSRTRTCSNPPPQYGGLDCVGDRNETQVCSDRLSCAIDGGWSDWSNWFGCTVTCGVGSNVRYRACNNPVPENHGKPCPGDFSENITCNSFVCPVDGNWADWGAWTSCSVTCSNGTSARVRNCSNPSPVAGGKPCTGSSSENKDCFDRECPIDGNWTDWSPWDSCSTTCDLGYRLHNRSCDNPKPQYGGAYCIGHSVGNETCNLGHCPVDGVWGPWQEWGDCSATCDNGTKLRSRTCDTPPQYGGANCSGINQESETCFKAACPVDGSWGSWSPWSPCTGDCTAANKQRFRNCDNPRPDPGGAYCFGDATDSQNCLPQNCTTVGPQTSVAYTSGSAPTTQTAVVYTNASVPTTQTAVVYTNASVQTTTAGAPIDFKCYECDTTIPEVCVALKRETICHEPYCINEFTNTADGKKLLDRRCGTKLECDKDWWKTTSDNDKCTLFDVTETVTNYVHCTFCCVDELCNDPIIPDAKSLYKPTS
ncbi:SCO-spondin-like [Mercenaria mercenaria]|uniref:SCO-spondin-like n=1 Tax=Mercenaria mercenaria TaxID=6596 RepID=UPI00234EFC4C|nr:SCO-spondin-like [Mercenaria mercenaria]